MEQGQTRPRGNHQAQLGLNGKTHMLSGEAGKSAGSTDGRVMHAGLYSSAKRCLGLTGRMSALAKSATIKSAAIANIVEL